MMDKWMKGKFWDNTFGYVELIKFFGLVFFNYAEKEKHKIQIGPRVDVQRTFGF
jgi:hypothetical protein